MTFLPLSLITRIFDEASPGLELQGEFCLRSRLSSSDCRLCIDVCAAGAISLTGRRIQLDPQKCTACMACTAVCPNEAFQGKYDLLSLLEAVSSRSQRGISCSRSRRKNRDDVAVPCLGVFSEESLLALGRSGIERITFDMEGCRVCANAPAAERFRTMVEHVRNLGEEWSTNLVIQGIATEAAGYETEDRRAYLSHCIDGLSKAWKNVRIEKHQEAYPQDDRGNGKKRIPTKVRILEKIIESAGEEQRDSLRELCCHCLIVSGECTMCRRCSAICPTGALTRQRSQPMDHLVFTATRCSGCRLCVLFCKEKALELRPPCRSKGNLPDPAAISQAKLTA